MKPQVLKMTRWVRKAVRQARRPPSGGGVMGRVSEVRRRESVLDRAFEGGLERLCLVEVGGKWDEWWEWWVGVVVRALWC